MHELHVRFGVSKQTVKRLVKNEFLTEMWGPKAIGVRFKLSKKGKRYLKKLNLQNVNLEQDKKPLFTLNIKLHIELFCFSVPRVSLRFKRLINKFTRFTCVVKRQQSCFRAL